MSSVKSETTEQLQQRYTNEISASLVMARLTQQFDPIVIWDGSFLFPIKMVLVIQLKKSYLTTKSTTTVYDCETNILGKAIRLLVELEELYNLFTTIEPYSVRSILVTTAQVPQQMNNHNKWVLEFEFAKTTVRQLITLKRHSTKFYEAAIASFIGENSVT